MKRFWSSLFFLFLLTAQACDKKVTPEVSCNFAQNSYLQRVSWATRPIDLHVDPSLSADQVESLKKAVEVWNGIFQQRFNTPQIFNLVGVLATEVGMVEDGVSVVSITKNWTGKSDEQAATVQHFVNDHIVEADIQLNGNFNLSVDDTVTADQVDTVALFVHELGHALGLGHNTSAEYTVMAMHLYHGNSERRTPGDADIDALRCEY